MIARRAAGFQPPRRARRPARRARWRAGPRRSDRGLTLRAARPPHAPGGAHRRPSGSVVAPGGERAISLADPSPTRPRRRLSRPGRRRHRLRRASRPTRPGGRARGRSARTVLTPVGPSAGRRRSERPLWLAPPARCGRTPPPAADAVEARPRADRQRRRGRAGTRDSALSARVQAPPRLGAGRGGGSGRGARTGHLARQPLARQRAAVELHEAVLERGALLLVHH